MEVVLASKHRIRGARRLVLDFENRPTTLCSTRPSNFSRRLLPGHQGFANRVRESGALLSDDGQPGSNANVADGGIRESTRSPIIRPWPLPPLRPKRAASGVAGLRYGSGQRKTNHALMSETSAGKHQPKAIPLNI